MYHTVHENRLLILKMFYLYYVLSSLFLARKKNGKNKTKSLHSLQHPQYTLIPMNKTQVLHFTCGPMTDTCNQNTGAWLCCSTCQSPQCSDTLPVKSIPTILLRFNLDSTVISTGMLFSRLQVPSQVERQ